LKVRKTSSGWIGVVVLLLLVSGCAGGAGPDIVSSEKKDGQVYSSEEVRTMAVDHPAMLSGDYFLKRDYAKKADDKPRPSFLAQHAEDSSDTQAPEKKDYVHTGQKNPQVPINHKIGLIVDPKDAYEPWAGSLQKAVDKFSGIKDRIIGPQNMANMVSVRDCRQKDYLLCMGKQAALYPGVHMIVGAQKFDLPESYPGKVSIRFRLLDTGLEHVYPLIEIVQVIDDAEEIDLFLENALGRVFAFASQKAGIMPAHCRVFSVKENRIYINAGKSGSISVGDQLEVVSSGRLVDTPSGVPVAWEPEAPKATLVVEKILREHVSACSLVKGTIPETGDIVLIPAAR
jgi:hypothetical protein